MSLLRPRDPCPSWTQSWYWCTYSPVTKSPLGQLLSAAPSQEAVKTGIYKTGWDGGRPAYPLNIPSQQSAV